MNLIGPMGHKMSKTYVLGAASSALLVPSGLLDSYLNFHPD